MVSFFMCDVWDIKVRLDQQKDLTIQTKQRSCEITHEGNSKKSKSSTQTIILMGTPEDKQISEGVKSSD